ncbi:MAG: site-specific integrase [Candidatus Competibacteraceae bacterium]|nr:site-specific integrase [Candidatus Competibacteraceae bacterium]
MVKRESGGQSEDNTAQLPEVPAEERVRLPLSPGRPLPALALGGWGSLRGAGEPLIAADNDLEAVAAWLAERAGHSERTLENYWSHVERLLLWAAEERGRCLSELTLEDYTAYRRFLADPQPRERWCGPRARRGSPEWRPFTGPLSAPSRRLALRIIGSLLSFLCAAGYLRANPLLLQRQSRDARQEDSRTVERFLDRQLWAAVHHHVERWPRDTPRERARYERVRWTLSLMVLLGLRRGEVVSHTQGIFRRRLRPAGEQWWAQITGKGSKTRVVPLPRPCLEALVRYRRHLGLTDLPEPDDETPLVCRLGSRRPITATVLFKLLKETLRGAADDLEGEDPAGAAHLRRAGPHWLRHTAITTQGDAGISLRHRGKSAGHSSVETTARYDHATEDLWYEEMQRVPAPW